MGVLKPKTFKKPTRVNTTCEMVTLGVGLVTVTGLLDRPPNVATKRSIWSGATYTWVELYLRANSDARGDGILDGCSLGQACQT